MLQRLLPALVRYGGAAGGVSLAILARFLLDPLLGNSYPLATLFFAVVITAGLAGFGPTLFATGLGAAVGTCLFLQPRFSIHVGRPEDRIALGVFVTLGILTAVLSRRAGQARTLEREVAERRRAQADLQENRERLQAALDALKEADRRKDEFLATLAHELRNPLAPVRNAVQILKLAGDDARAMRKACGIIERQVAQMVRLVDDLMDVSRISQGKLALQRERTGLLAVIQMAVETSRPLIEAAGHELRVDLPPSDLELDADPARLAQVLSNLLSNAAKYMERGGSIRMSAAEEDGQAVIRVRDTGIGIPADALERIFHPFAQMERSLERSQGGLGIGLALVRSLVELHGGTVVAHSDGPGKGSELMVRLPLASSSIAAAGPAGKPSRMTAP